MGVIVNFCDKLRKGCFQWSFPFVGIIFLVLLGANESHGLRLTNMTAPAIQDPRKDMELHCQFDMGGEELYAVKWYKDDHEFFRYTPGSVKDNLLQFPVDGVHVESKRSRCVRDGCDLLLTGLARPESSGAYRCEVSSEAPAFRLASQTHNVTVAALPQEHPAVEGLKDTYLIGDLLTATCTSGMGDPKPTLTWFVNKQQVSSKSVRELPSRFSDINNDRIKLKSSVIQLKLPLDKKLTQSTNLDISCVSSLEGINPTVAPHLAATKSVLIVDQNQLVNNQKLHSPYNGAPHQFSFIFLVYSLTLLVNYC